MVFFVSHFHFHFHFHFTYLANSVSTSTILAHPSTRYASRLTPHASRLMSQALWHYLTRLRSWSENSSSTQTKQSIRKVFTKCYKFHVVIQAHSHLPRWSSSTSPWSIYCIIMVGLISRYSWRLERGIQGLISFFRELSCSKHKFHSTALMFYSIPREFLTMRTLISSCWTPRFKVSSFRKLEFLHSTDTIEAGCAESGQSLHDLRFCLDSVELVLIQRYYLQRRSSMYISYRRVSRSEPYRLKFERS